ncbi:SgcJ/EcaC family oxidoreductase [Microbispora hainanensis]|uniref:SgcJ/EcaC family oxidoreductase n=1 Tax=Microbispora hainanensis TaxID=568844 RepID=A0A544YKL1_9ACTN|nr:SgcJ/EcaC family oxidoreductase [Microbispora hainanensis]TQS17313.1 SgcJ/EcaC family oxidoreductase [Microbispora hainanensis]
MSPEPHQAAIEPAEERAVRALFEATSAAWSDGDGGTFAGRYAPDATVILPGVHLRGRDGIRSAMGAAFEGSLKGFRRVHAPEGIRFPVPDVALVITRSVTVFAGEEEPPADRWELATWTLIRRDEEWLVEAYHSSPA